MDKKEIAKIIMILKTSYPYAFKDMSKEETESMVNLYGEMFKDDDYNELSKAIIDIIKTSEYLPSIATIKNKLYNSKHKDEDNSELWNKLKNAIGRSSYYAEEEYNKLPDILKSYVRSPYRLQEMASMDSDVINSVEKGIFMKQIENIKQNYKENEITGRNLLQEKKIYQLEDMEEK